MAKLAPTNRYLAAMELLENDPESGLDELEELSELYPSDSRVLFGLGVAHIMNGDHHSALEPLEQALKRERVHTEAVHLALAGVYNRLNMPAHAFQALMKSGTADGTWAEQVTPSHPAEESLPDMLGFEAARHELIYRRNNVPVAMRRLKALIDRYPDYVPARNILSTALFMDGQLEEAQAQADAVLAQDAHNPHALLNLARVWRLTRGQAAVRELLSRIENEGQLSEDDADHHLLRANMAALLDDVPLTRAALNSFDLLYDGPSTPPVDTLRESLEFVEASGDPHSPVFGLNQLLPSGLMQRWQRGGTKRIRAELNLLPGLFEGLPERLVYQPAKAAQAFTGLMLAKEVYAGGELLHGLDRAGWTQRFLDILSRAELGSEEGRFGVVQALQQLELLPPGFGVVSRDGNEVQAFSLQLHSQNVLTDMSKADQKRMRHAIELAHQEKYEEAMNVYRELALRYPKNPRPRYNLLGIQQALAEARGDQPALQEAEREFERIAQEFPNYLHPRATLAVLAIQRGQLERAGELLRLPEGLQRQPLHMDEYAYFASAQALLALEHGKEKSVANTLLLIMQTAGPDSIALRMFMNGLKEYRQRHGQPADEDTLIDQIGTWLGQADTL